VKIMSVNIFFYEPFCMAQRYIFVQQNQDCCSTKPRFLSSIDFSSSINCKTFSVVPSIINEKAKNVLFHWVEGMQVDEMTWHQSFWPRPETFFDRVVLFFFSCHFRFNFSKHFFKKKFQFLFPNGLALSPFIFLWVLLKGSIWSLAE